MGLRSWGGHLRNGQSLEFSRAAAMPPRHFSHTSPQNTSLVFQGPALPPLPSYSNCQGHWLERPWLQPCLSRPHCGGGGRSYWSCPSFPLSYCCVAHFPFPYRVTEQAVAAGGRSPVLEGDQQPGIQDVLLWFPRVISCKGKGRGTWVKNTKPALQPPGGE